LNAALNAGAGTVTLGGAVDGAGLLTAATLNLNGAGNVGSSGARVNTTVGTLALNKPVSGDTFLNETDGLNLQGMTAGALDVKAGGTIGQLAALTVGGTATFDVPAAGSDVLLAGFANQLAAVTITSARSVALRNATATPGTLTLPASLTDLTIRYDVAGITLPSGAATVTGTLDVDAQGITTSGDLAAGNATLKTTTLALNHNLNTGAGAVTIEHSGALTVGNPAATITAGTLTLKGAGAVASGAQRLNTAVAALALDKVGGNSFVNEANGLNLSGATGGGNLDLLDAGPTTLNAALNTGAGTVTLGGVVNGLGLLTADTLNLNGAGDVGALATRLNTAVNMLVLGKTAGNSFLSEADGLNLSGATGGGNLDLMNAGATTLNAALDAGAGTVTLDGAVDGPGLLTADTFNLNGAGNVGASGARLNTAVKNLVFAKVSGHSFLSEADGLNLSGATGGDNLNLLDAGTTTLNAALTAGAGTVTLDGAVDGPGLLTASTLNLNGAGNVGSAGTRVNTTLGTLALKKASGDTFLNETDGINVQGITGGALNVQAGGTIGQLAVLNVSGLSTFTVSAPLADLSLALAPNVFNGGVALGTTGGGSFQDISLWDASPAPIFVAGLPGALRNLTLRYDNAGIVLPAVTLTGDLNVRAGGAISQSGALVVNGAGRTATFNAGTGNDITLNDPANDFTTATLVAGRNVALRDANAVTLGASTISGTFDLTAGGSVVQSGTLRVTSAARLDSTGDITLADPANDFGAQVTVLNGQAVTLQDANMLVVGGGSTSLDVEARDGGLVLAGYTTTTTLAGKAAGNISQDGTVTVGTTTTLDASGDITLDSVLNDFGGLVTVLNGQAVALKDANSLTVAGASGSLNAEATGGDLTLAGYATATTLAGKASANIAQSGALNVGTTTALDAGGNITLADVLNDFAGLVTVLNGQAVTLKDANTLAVTGTSGSLDAEARGGDLTLAGYTAATTLAGKSSASIVQNGAVTVGTTATLDAANNIALADVLNDFAGLVTVLNGQAVTLKDANSLTVGGASANLDAEARGGDLTFAGYTTATTLAGKASANISQSGVVNVSTTTTLDAGGNVTLADVLNDFGGLVTVLNGQAVALKDANSLTVAGVSGSLDAEATGGDLTLAGYVTGTTLAGKAAANIAQSGALNVGTTTTLDAGADITLADVLNEFASLVTVLNGQAVTLKDANSLTVGGASGSLDAEALGGDLTLAGYTTTTTLAGKSSASINQSGAVTVGTTTTLDAANHITLADVLNDFAGLVTVLNGQAVTLKDANSLTVGGASGSLDAEARGGDLTLTGFTTATTLAGRASANLLQSGTLNVGTTTTLGAGGNITLADVLNEFAGLVTVLNGQAVTLKDANTLAVTGMSGSLDAEARGGDLTLAGYTTTATLAGKSSANIVQNGAVNAGTTTTLDAANNITLADVLNDFGGLVTVLNGQAVTLQDANSLTVGGASATLDAEARGGDLTFAGYTTASTLAGKASANIAQSGTVMVGTTTMLDAGANVTLADPNNEFTGPVTVTAGGNATLTDANSINVSGTVGGTLTVNAAGSATVDGGLGGLGINAGSATLAGVTVGGAGLTINAGTVDETAPAIVNGPSVVNVGNGTITLDTQPNQFFGAVSLLGRDVFFRNIVNAPAFPTFSQPGLHNLRLLYDNAPVTFSALALTGTLDVDTKGIAQAGALTVGGAATLTAGAANNITLDNAGNDFQSDVSVVSANHVALRDANALRVGLSTASGNLSLTAGGDVTQSGRITAQQLDVTTLSDAAASITLTDPANDADTVSFRVRNAADSANGTGNIDYRDADGFNAGFITGGDTTLNGGGTINLTGASQTRNAAVTAAGGADDLNLNADLTASGDVVLTASRDINVNRVLTAHDVTFSAGRDVIEAVGANPGAIHVHRLSVTTARSALFGDAAADATIGEHSAMTAQPDNWITEVGNVTVNGLFYLADKDSTARAAGDLTPGSGRIGLTIAGSVHNTSTENTVIRTIGDLEIALGAANFVQSDGGVVALAAEIGMSGATPVLNSSFHNYNTTGTPSVSGRNVFIFSTSPELNTPLIPTEQPGDPFFYHFGNLRFFYGQFFKNFSDFQNLGLLPGRAYVFADPPKNAAPDAAKFFVDLMKLPTQRALKFRSDFDPESRRPKGRTYIWTSSFKVPFEKELEEEQRKAPRKLLTGVMELQPLPSAVTLARHP
ncbi:MAG: hypothetical protein HZA90_01820, partial [Verrucomicrobia bacterium]|nr:hypothetical protein [Verrucomicrobiota bacterium]